MRRHYQHSPPTLPPVHLRMLPENVLTMPWMEMVVLTRYLQKRLAAVQAACRFVMTFYGVRGDVLSVAHDFAT